MAHFAPVSGYHIGGDRQPGGAAELGHHLPAGETLLGAARIFGVGQNILQPFTQRDGLIQQPGAVRVDGDARIRETLFQRPRGVNLLLAGQHAAFELKVFETVAILGRLPPDALSPRCSTPAGGAGGTIRDRPAYGPDNQGRFSADRRYRTGSPAR